MPATVLAEQVGWEGSIRWFRDNVRRIRREKQRVDPADRREWAAGDAAQRDLWFPPKRIRLPDGASRLRPALAPAPAHSRLRPALAAAPAHSRFAVGRMIPTRRTEDLLPGSRELIERLGRVLPRLIWDNEPGIGRSKRHGAGVEVVIGALAVMLPLPPIPPEPGWCNTIRLGREYPVGPRKIGRAVEVAADLDRVRVR